MPCCIHELVKFIHDILLDALYNTILPPCTPFFRSSPRAMIRLCPYSVLIFVNWCFWIAFSNVAWVQSNNSSFTVQYNMTCGDAKFIWDIVCLYLFRYAHAPGSYWHALISCPGHFHSLYHFLSDWERKSAFHLILNHIRKEIVIENASSMNFIKITMFCCFWIRHLKEFLELCKLHFMVVTCLGYLKCA